MLKLISLLPVAVLTISCASVPPAPPQCPQPPQLPPLAKVPLPALERSFTGMTENFLSGNLSEPTNSVSP